MPQASAQYPPTIYNLVGSTRLYHVTQKEKVFIFKNDDEAT
jgi:hypothetical protein